MTQNDIERLADAVSRRLRGDTWVTAVDARALTAKIIRDAALQLELFARRYEEGELL